jgi:uncharacterized protein YndB with AHSA1/START domain
MERQVSVSREMHATPEAVWAAISDVTRMGDWSPECHACEWAPGVSAPAVGARFFGHNRNGEKEWTTEAEITECEPGRVLAFDGVFGDLRFSHWRYEIEPTADGCRVTESWEDGRPEEIIPATTSISGVADRATHNRAGMEQTLTRLAAAVEV